MPSKLFIRLHESKKQEDSAYESIADVFRDLGYSVAEESDDNRLICYLDLATGLDTPKYASVIARYNIKSSDLLVEVAAGAYGRTTEDGSIKDMFYTFIGTELEHSTFDQVKKACKDAEKAANFYIKALRACRTY